MRVESRTDCRSAECELAQLRHGGLHRREAVVDLRDPPADLLAEREGGGVLQVGPAGLDVVPEASSRGVESGFEPAERGVEVEVMPRMPLVIGDATRLVQVLQNLVENGIKFNQPGGSRGLGCEKSSMSTA